MGMGADEWWRTPVPSLQSALSSAPVATLSAFSRAAPRSSACRLNTPQNVQLPRWPTSLTIASIVQPSYRSA